MPTASFEPAPESARGAREFVRDHLTGYPSSDQELAVLLVSELATNAIIHVGQPFKVRVDLSTPPCIWVGVDDPSPLRPKPRQPADTDTTGRGLNIIAAIADRWGIDPTPTGKRVWFELGGFYEHGTN